MSLTIGLYLFRKSIRIAALGSIATGVVVAGVNLGIRRVMQDPQEPTTWKEDIKDSAADGMEVAWHIVKCTAPLALVVGVVGGIFPSLIAKKDMENLIQEMAPPLLEVVKAMGGKVHANDLNPGMLKLADYLVKVGKLVKDADTFYLEEDLSEEEEKLLNELHRQQEKFRSGQVPLYLFHQDDQTILRRLVNKGKLKMREETNPHVYYVWDPLFTPSKVKVPTTTSN